MTSPLKRAAPSAPSGSGGRRRGSYAKSGATRTAILDAALRVFADSGFRAGSLREIASRVEMSEAGVLHHFRTKSALLLAVLHHRDDLARPTLRQDAADPLDTLRGFVEIARHNATVPGVVELYATISGEATSSDHPAHDWFRQRYADVRVALTGTFERLSVLGLLRPGVDPVSAAVRTIAVTDGLQIQWLLAPDAIDLAAEVEAALQEFVIGDLSSAPAAGSETSSEEGGPDDLAPRS